MEEERYGELVFLDTLLKQSNGKISALVYRKWFPGPETLLQLREDMMLANSSLSVDCRNIVLSLSFER